VQPVSGINEAARPVQYACRLEKRRERGKKLPELEEERHGHRDRLDNAGVISGDYIVLPAGAGWREHPRQERAECCVRLL
jgi:hypothetical protein